MKKIRLAKAVKEKLSKRRARATERDRFESWAKRELGIDAADIADMRTEVGYSSTDLDFAWLGWESRSKRG